MSEPVAASRFVRFTRAEWARLRASTPLTLAEDDLDDLRGINERISLDEVADVYLPLSRLLNLYVSASQSLHRATDTFFRADERPEGRRRRRAREPLGGRPAAQVPYVLAIAGSVAVGKSTTARILQALLARWPDHPRVDLVTTDGFLLPNRLLESQGLMERKGFPESYDLRRLVRFLADVKAGNSEVRAPVYSHLTYDIVDGEEQVVRQPDIVILEGLTVLQTGDGQVRRSPSLFVSDFFDFSIYVDAEEPDIEQWYIDRFLTLRETAFRDERSFFRHFASLSEAESVGVARSIWRGINGVNLRDNILPTRERAHLILEKARDHTVQGVRLRKL